MNYALAYVLWPESLSLHNKCALEDLRLRPQIEDGWKMSLLPVLRVSCRQRPDSQSDGPFDKGAAD